MPKGNRKFCLITYIIIGLYSSLLYLSLFSDLEVQTDEDAVRGLWTGGVQCLCGPAECDNCNFYDSTIVYRSGTDKQMIQWNHL